MPPMLPPSMPEPLEVDVEDVDGRLGSPVDPPSVLEEEDVSAYECLARDGSVIDPCMGLG